MVISYLDIVHPTSGHQIMGKMPPLDPLDFGAPYSQRKMDSDRHCHWRKPKKKLDSRPLSKKTPKKHPVFYPSM